MDLVLGPLTGMEIYYWEEFINNWFFVVAVGILLLEMVRYALRRRLDWHLAGDVVTNFITLSLYLGLSYALFGALYVWAYFYFSQFALFDIGINWLTVAVCVVLADLAYYWEHRFAHRVSLAWATHTVHHSSPYFNISVAYRFGPMDGFWGIFFHLPLILLGLNPFIVFFSEMFVQLYQTLLHTEAVRRLPRPVEAVMNTPSHHRVHHGSNQVYLDKNYGGIFILWDRLFGTFAREEEAVVYGLVEPINSINPLVAFLHGFQRLFQKAAAMPTGPDRFASLVMPPGWEPEKHDKVVGKKTESQ